MRGLFYGESILAIKAVNLTRTINYQSESDPDRGTDDATTFVIGALDARVLGAIKDKATEIPMSAFTGGEGANATLNTNRTNFELVVHGLKNWTNFLDEKGNPIPYNTAHKNLGGKSYLVTDPDLVNKLENDLIDELANVVINFNQMSDTERKNSEGPSSE